MDQIATISEFLDLAPDTFKAILKGKRNMSFKRAKKLGLLLKCDKDIWQDEERINERQEVWGRYILMEALN